MSPLDATDRTDTMRERLARAVVARRRMRWEEATKQTQRQALSDVDAILREIQEPSEGMKRQMFLTKYMDQGPVVMWRAMIQHILDGGK